MAKTLSPPSLNVKKDREKRGDADASSPKLPAAPKARRLLSWYDRNRRILPWRALPGEQADPYHIWLSEVMLQQTTVVTVGPYYQRFLKRWPRIEDLAAASLDEVRQLWAGLGYYRRAQSLHECAELIVGQFGGHFPNNETALQELPGFGPYTSAAVSAIAFGQRANVVDGNVERVVARIFAIETPLSEAKQIIRAAAATLLPSSRFGDYAQALMDLGSLICTPRNPKCDVCPWKENCRAFSLNLTDAFPRRLSKKKRLVRRGMAFVLADKDGNIFLRQRDKGGLLGGMLEIPSTPWAEGEFPSLTAAKKSAPVDSDWSVLPGTIRHIFSHFELELKVAVGRIEKARTQTHIVTGGNKTLWLSPLSLREQALPSVMLKVLRHALGLI